MEHEKCPICGNDVDRCFYTAYGESFDNEIDDEIDDEVYKFFECPVCGRFELKANLLTEIIDTDVDLSKLGIYLFYKQNPTKDNKSLLPVIPKFYTMLSKEKCDQIRARSSLEITDRGMPIHFDEEEIESWFPKTLAEKTNMVLLKLTEYFGYVGQRMEFSSDVLFYVLMGDLRNKNKQLLELHEKDRQLRFYLQYLYECGFVENTYNNRNAKWYLTITSKGYQRIEQLQGNHSEGRDVLVAMSFAKGTEGLREAIKMGIRDAGYHPVLIDEVEHNELITPELLSYIRRSKFVVVDLSHQNNGAYFEEGYAMGLGKPVIQLCKKDVKLHFDIAQKNTIIWESESDIPSRLKNRIIATIE